MRRVVANFVFVAVPRAVVLLHETDNVLDVFNIQVFLSDDNDRAKAWISVTADWWSTKDS